MAASGIRTTFGRFQVVRVVRHDGARTWYEAVDPELAHRVALVTWPGDFAAAEDDRLAFWLPRMRHPNIVSVLDAGRQGSVAFVATEWLETEPLSEFLARTGHVPVFQGLALVLQLLSALEYAHARGMVHATIDVEHVQVTRTGQLKLPAHGWLLSADRHPNLDAAARIAQALLSGVSGDRRRLLDEVLLRARGQGPGARYPRADDFARALRQAADLRGGSRPARLAPAEMPAPRPGPVSEEDVAMDAPRAPRRPIVRRRVGRVLAAASLVAAMLVPNLIEDGRFTQGKDPAASTVRLQLRAPGAPGPAMRLALAPRVAPAVESGIPAADPCPPAPDTNAPLAVAGPLVSPQPVQPAALPPPSTRAGASPRPVSTTLPTAAPARAARPRPALALTPVSACSNDSRFGRDLCEVQQCRRTELRKTPVCVRILAAQRASLARLRGTPD